MKLIDANVSILRATFRTEMLFSVPSGKYWLQQFWGPHFVLTGRWRRWSLEVWLGFRWSPWWSVKPGHFLGEFPGLRVIASWPKPAEART